MLNLKVQEITTMACKGGSKKGKGGGKKTK